MEADQCIGDQKNPDFERDEGTVTEGNAFNDFDEVVGPFSDTVGENIGHQ